MSTDANINLYERAAELIDELTSHPAGLDKRLMSAVESNDLDELYYQICVAESVLAQEHFNELEATDAY